MNISGAINIKTREVISDQYDTINSKNVIIFLKKILENYAQAKTIHVILDGAGYYTSKEVEEFLKGAVEKWVCGRSPQAHMI